MKLARLARLARTTAFGAASALVLFTGTAQADPRAFDVQAQPLAPALWAWSEQADIEILFDAALTAGVSTNGVSGSEEPAHALEQLLRDTGLTFDWSGPATVVIRRLHTPAGEQPPASSTISSKATGVEEVFVVGSRAAQAAALNTERRAAGVTNVVSSDQIGRFPDENAAEAARRLPGVSIVTNRGEGRFVSIRGAEPSFVGVAVDGVNLPNQEGDRSVALDTVPAEQLGSIEVSKTTTPNQDAEGLGGRVNLITKSPFDFTDRYLFASAGAGASEQNHDASMQGSFAVADRFGADDQLGALLSASYTKYPRGLENVTADDWAQHTVGGNTGMTPGSIEVEDRRFDRERIGVSGRLEWRPTDAARYFLSARYNTFDLDEYRQRVRADLNKPTAAGGVDDGDLTDVTDTNHNIRKRWDFVETDQVDYNIALGGSNSAGGGTLDYQVSYASATEDSTADEVEFSAGGFNTILSPATGSDLRLTPAGGADRLDASRYKYSQSDNRVFDRDDSEVAAQLNWAHAADWFGMTGEFKSGIKAQDRDKSSDTQRTRFDGVTSPLLLSDPRVLGGAPSLRSLDGFEFGPEFSDSGMRGLVATPGLFHTDAVRSFQDSLLDDYDIKEKIHAAYVMYTGSTGSWTFIPGVRVETTDTEASFWRDEDSGQAVNDPARYTYTTQKRNHTDWFPSLTVRFEPREDLVLRAAVTRTIARPKFSDLAAAREVDQRDFLLDPTSPIEISQGNPDLQPIRSQNFDLRADWYFSRLGLLSVAAFQKNLDGPIYEQTLDTTYEGHPAEVTQPLNAGKGRISGVELAFTRQFDFLPGALAGLGVYANVTFVDSSVDVPTRPDEDFRLFAQSNVVGNVALTYQDYGFDGRIALNHQGGYLESLNEPGLDVYVDDRTTLDFSMRYSLNAKFTVFVQGENLTDEPLRHYFGSRSRLNVDEYYGRFMLAGAELTF
ncbi:MAG TPA: TonB-dependent receptor [Steroidobacteraceae bacterium]